jgi:hypothetical protein
MLTIRTNNARRDIVEAYGLSAKERAEFDYLDWPAIDAGNDSRSFFRYKGQVYDLGEFMRCGHACGMESWDGYFSDSMFSGVLVKYAGRNSDSVIVGMYFS